MFIPLHDANGLKHIRLQYVTLALIAANVLVYLMTAVGTEQFTEAAVWGLGYIPSTVFDIAERPPQMVLVPDNASARASRGPAASSAAMTAATMPGVSRAGHLIGGRPPGVCRAGSPRRTGRQAARSSRRPVPRRRRW